MSVIAVTINPGLTIVGVLPAAQPSTAYTYQLTGYGGTPPYTFSTSDTLPGDFELHPDGTFDATTGSALAGAFPFTVTMTDKLGRSTMRSFTLKIIALPLSIAGSLTDAQVGVAWSKNLTISGGIAPYSEPIVIHGPSWMNVSISGTTMTVSGTPTAGYADDYVAISITDSQLNTAQFDVSFGWATLTLTGTYPDAVKGQPYSADLTISGGNGVYSLTGGDGVVSGTLPAGLSLSIVQVGSAWKLRCSGTSTDDGSHSVTVGIGSGDGQSVTSAQTFVIGAAGYSDIIIASNPLGYWKCDETSGSTIHDSSGNGHHGIVNTGGSLGGTALRAGSTGALESTTYTRGNKPGTISTVGWIPSSSSDWSMEAIINITDGYITGCSIIATASRGGGYGTPVLLTISQDYGGGLKLNVTGSRNVSSGLVFNNGTHHVAGTFEFASRTLSIYIDGSIAKTVSYTPFAPDAFSNTLYLLGDASYYCSVGRISDVAFYDRVLTAQEISDHYQAASLV